MAQTTIKTFTKLVDCWLLFGEKFLHEWSERYGGRTLYADVDPHTLFGEFRDGSDGRFRWDEALDAVSGDNRLLGWGYYMYAFRCEIRAIAPALFAEIRALGGDVRDAVKVVHHANYATHDRWNTVRRNWPEISASLAAMEAAQSLTQPQPDNTQSAGGGPIPETLRERAEEAMLDAATNWAVPGVVPLIERLRAALGGGDEAELLAAHIALAGAIRLPGAQWWEATTGGALPVNAAELLAAWVTAGRAPGDLAGDWTPATVAELVLAAWRGRQPAGNGQDGARKPTINTRMLELVQRDLARVSGWTAKEWAAELQCSPPAVVATPTWKDLAMARERQKAERKADRRRRKRPAKRD